MTSLSSVWFEFKGIRSDTLGIKMMAMPTRTFPQRNVTKKTVPGRNGSLRIDDESYGDAEVRAEFTLTDETKFDQAFKLLMGSGTLRFSDEQDRTYKAYVDAKYSRSPLGKRLLAQRMTVTFVCDPFKSAYPVPSDITISTSGTSITNPGTVNSLPRVTITGSGSFSVTIGSHIMSFSLSASHTGIIVDSELMDAFTTDGLSLANSEVLYNSSGFFEIEPGSNTVSWAGIEDEEGNVGSVSRVVISPRWRYA